MDIGSTYYIIRASSEQEIHPLENKLTDMDLMRGAFLGLELNDSLVFELDVPKGSAPPHFLGHRFPIVSRLFVDVLSSVGVNNFELFPAEIRNSKTKELWDGYSLFNVIGLLDAADLESSVGEILFENEHGPDWMEFEDLVLSRDRTLGMDMFRLANNPEIVLVHGRVLKAMIEKVPNSGWGFTSMEVELR